MNVMLKAIGCQETVFLQHNRYYKETVLSRE